MPKFLFHLRDGVGETLDPDGVECADLAAAKTKALHAVRDLIAGEVREGKVDLTAWVDVEDAHGTIVYTLQFENAVTFKHPVSVAPTFRHPTRV
jgi:hypothetical protein